MVLVRVLACTQFRVGGLGAMRKVPRSDPLPSSQRLLAGRGEHDSASQRSRDAWDGLPLLFLQLQRHPTVAAA
jgi:hypothetical protein